MVGVVLEIGFEARNRKICGAPCKGRPLAAHAFCGQLCHLGRRGFRFVKNAVSSPKVAILALLFVTLHAQVLDVLIKNGSIVDGSGSPAETMDVGIQADRITFLGKNSHPRASRVIDASGLIVAPGFIDPHTHTLGDLNNPERHGNEPYLMQGVTTVVTGNDGSSPIDIARVLAHWKEAGIGTNAALFIGQGSVRAEVMGMSDAHASSDQIARMKALVARGLKAGAVGMSTGLYYAPGSFASTEEIVAL